MALCFARRFELVERFGEVGVVGGPFIEVVGRWRHSFQLGRSLAFCRRCGHLCRQLRLLDRCTYFLRCTWLRRLGPGVVEYRSLLAYFGVVFPQEEAAFLGCRLLTCVEPSTVIFASILGLELVGGHAWIAVTVPDTI